MAILPFGLGLLGFVGRMGPAQPVNALSRFAAPASHSQPRFKLIDDHGTWWLVGPDKKRFFSLGVCCVEPGTSFAEYDTKNPSYAAFKYYPEGKQAWAEDVVQRLQSWNFNTIGAWSDTKTLKGVNAPNLRFTPILHMGSGAGAPWKDMWDPAVIGLMSDIARDQIKDLRAEPRVIGYFSDNEQGWWNGALFDWAWKGPNTRRKLVSQLADRYKTWAALMRDFDPEGARSFHDLQSSGRLFLRPGGNGRAHLYRNARIAILLSVQLTHQEIRPECALLGRPFHFELLSRGRGGGREICGCCLDQSERGLERRHICSVLFAEPLSLDQEAPDDYRILHVRQAESDRQQE